MKRSTILLISAFLLSLGLHFPAVLRSQPQLANPYETDNLLNDIAFRNATEGYAVVQPEPLLLKTTDAGVTWNSIPLPIDPHTFNNIYTAVRTIGERGLIVGNAEGNILVASDLNSEWSDRSPDEGLPIREIEVIDENGWAVISDSSIFWTRDGGLTYRQFKPGNNLAFLSLDITNPSVIHAAQTVYQVWRTTDGGEHWDAMSSPGFGFGQIYDVDFPSPDTGFVASWYPWTLFTTFDGGKTWHNNISGAEYPTSLAVLQGGMGIYTTLDYLRITHDGGVTWTDSLGISPLVIEGNPDGPFGWSKYKVVAATDDVFFLLLSQSDFYKSVLARIDVTSGVIESVVLLPGRLDLR